MNALEQKMISMLKDLKDNYNVVGVKTEFETETIQLQELQILKDIATEAGLELTLKISGCGSIRDICDAGTFGISSIVAPMIESVYAAKKFIKTVEIDEDYNNRNITITNEEDRLVISGKFKKGENVSFILRKGLTNY